MKIAEKTLANGLRVIVIPDKRSQIVTHSIWYRVGASDEVAGKTGLAHFLEHLMFKGTTKYPYGSYDRILTLNGAQGNAFTTQDYTAYYQRTIKDRLPLMMDLEADRMQNLVLTEDLVKPELLVVHEERRQRVDGEAGGLLGEEAEAALFQTHPYGRPTIGFPKDVTALTMADAVAFYQLHYRPSNAVVIVAGDVAAEAVFAIAGETYGRIAPATAAPGHKRYAEAPGTNARRVKRIDARAASPFFSRTYLAPSYATQKEFEAVSLDFFASWLGSGVQSQMYRKLVLEKKLAAYAGAWFNSSPRDHGRFSVYAIPSPGVRIADLEKAVDDVISESLAAPVPVVDIDRVRRQAKAELVYAFDNQLAVVRTVGSTVMSGLPASEAFDTNDWDTVTPQTIASAVASVVTLQNSVTSILLPQDE